MTERDESVMPSSEDFRTCAIHCLRAPDDPHAAEESRRLLTEPGFDWSGFSQYCIQQRIAPLIWEYTGRWGILPKPVETALQRTHFENGWFNSLRLEELDHLLELFEAENIPVILLKGVALLNSIYPKAALRPMGDMDLLIPAEAMERAAQVMLDQGYSRGHPFALPGDMVGEVAFQKAGRLNWAVELHTSLFSGPHFMPTEQLNWFIERAKPVNAETRSARIFDPDAQLLHLSAHLWLNHAGGHLVNLYDIYKLIQISHTQIQWDAVLETAQAFDLLMPLQQVLPELAANWGSPIPDIVISRLRQMSPSVREKRKFGKVYSPDGNYLEIWFGRTMSFPNWSQRIRYTWSFMFPPARLIMEKYQTRHSIRLPFLYAHRILARVVQQIKRVLN